MQEAAPTPTTGVTTPTTSPRPTSGTSRSRTAHTIQVDAESATIVSALSARIVLVKLTTPGPGPSQPFPSPPRGTQASAQARPSSIPSHQPPGDSSEYGILYMGMNVREGALALCDHVLTQDLLKLILLPAD